MIIHDVSEYITQNVNHPPFYLQHLLPVGGSLLLYGRAGEMKSWVAQHMAFCIATGTDWLDLRTAQARCLLANFEISQAGYHERLVLMSRQYEVEPGMLYEASPSIMFLEEPGVFEEFKQAVDSIDPDVLILDCLSGCFGGDENSSREMSGFLRHVDELKGNRRGIVIIHHSNKNLLVASPMDKARGHSKLVGYVDSILYLVRQGDTRQVQFGKTRLCPFVIHSKNIVFEDYVWRLQ